MAVSCAPVVDQANPLYCPTLSASEFLSSIRAHSDLAHLSFYTRLSRSLECVANEADSSYAGFDIAEIKAHAYLVKSSTLAHIREQDDGERRASAKRPLADVSSDDTFMALRGPAKRERSNVSQDDTSFILSAKAGRLRFPSSLEPDSSCGPHFRRLVSASRFKHSELLPEWEEFGGHGNHDQFHDKWNAIQLLEEELYGPDIGNDAPGCLGLINHLATITPGCRLQYLAGNGNLAQQDVLNELSHLGLKKFLLAQCRFIDQRHKLGRLDATVLNSFRRSDIRHLDLRESACGSKSCGAARKEMLKVLKLPNSFLSLNCILLSGTPLDDYDVTTFHQLPHLQHVYINDTQIGNEAVMHLASLKHTLKTLDISDNPLIDNDSIPGLLILQQLEYVCLKGTGVMMDGIRKLASVIANDSRDVCLDIPNSCKDYLQNLRLHYELYPEPPLISEPSICEHLTDVALQRNLLAHAACNSSIAASGTRAEMINRLTVVLETRKKDLIAQAFVLPKKPMPAPAEDEDDVF